MVKKALSILTAAGLIAGVMTSCAGDNDKDGDKTVKLAYVNWSEGIAMTNLAAAVIEEKLDYSVELTMADVAPVFTSVASGNTDAFLDVWLPVTHKDYMKKYSDDLIDLGISYENAKIGLVVPSYVDVNSIEELNANADLFDATITGIDAGAGIMSTTQTAIDKYGLSLKLMTGSGPTMTAALSKAIQAKEPIVVTGWTPHWMFAKWDLKFLADEKGVYGESESIHKVARKGLEDDMPDVASFLKAFSLNDADLGDLMGAIEDSDKDPKEAAKQWMDSHEELVDDWLK